MAGKTAGASKRPWSVGTDGHTVHPADVEWPNNWNVRVFGFALAGQADRNSRANTALIVEAVNAHEAHAALLEAAKEMLATLPNFTGAVINKQGVTRREAALDGLRTAVAQAEAGT